MCAARRATALSRNRFLRREEILEGLDLVVRPDADDHVTLGENRVRRRSGVERPVLAAERNDECSGLLAHPQIADRPAGSGARALHLDLLEAEIGTARVRDDVEERRYLGFHKQVRHHSTCRRVGKYDSIGAREAQLLLRLLVRCTRDDYEVRTLCLRRERDVEIVGVVIRGCYKPTRPTQTCTCEMLVFRSVALDEEDVLFARAVDCRLAEVQHDERRVRATELLGHPPANPSETADDVVVVQPFDRPSPPPFTPRIGDDAASDQLDESGRDVGEDCHADEEQDDREELGGRVARLRVDPGEGHGHDRAIERVHPPLAERSMEPDRAESQGEEQRRRRIGESAEAEVLHRLYRRAAWTATVPSASSTSISIRSRWRGRTRTSPTSRSRPTN